MTISRKMRWTGHVACLGKLKDANRIFKLGKPEGSRPLGRPRHRWEDNFKTDVKGIGFEGADWIHVLQDGDQ
jgi:hypothetical protein